MTFYQNERERAISQGSECKTTQEMSPRPASTGEEFTKKYYNMKLGHLMTIIRGQS